MSRLRTASSSEELFKRVARGDAIGRGRHRRRALDQPGQVGTPRQAGRAGVLVQPACRRSASRTDSFTCEAPRRLRSGLLHGSKTTGCCSVPSAVAQGAAQHIGLGHAVAAPRARPAQHADRAGRR